MKKIILRFMSGLIIWFLVITILLFAQEKKVTLLEEVIAGIKYNESLLKDYKFTCFQTIKPQNTPPWEEVWVWGVKGKKLYREKKEKGKDTPHTIVSFDGEVLRIWGNNNKAIIKVPTDKDFLNSFFITVGINSHPCYLLEIIWKGKEVGPYYIEYQLWIDYKRGFRPIKMIEAIKDKNGNPSLKDVIEVELEKFGENIWFPIKGKIEGWVYDEKGGIRAHTIYELTLKNIEINTGLLDTFFKIQFPKGTKVYDDRTGVNYNVE